jgi:hypothetical protein
MSAISKNERMVAVALSFRPSVDLHRLIRELSDMKKHFDRTIAALEGLAGTLDIKPVKSRRGRKSMDARERREVSERMKRYWAGRRAEEKHEREIKSAHD